MTRPKVDLRKTAHNILARINSSNAYHISDLAAFNAQLSNEAFVIDAANFVKAEIVYI